MLRSFNLHILINTKPYAYLLLIDRPMPGDRDHDRDRFPMDELNGKYARKAPHNTSLQLHRPTLTVTHTNIGFAPRPNSE